MASEGAAVMCADINAEGAQTTAAQIAEHGGRSATMELDVTSEAAVADALAQTVSVLGGLDVLMNNAGIGGAYSWDQTISVNLTGVYYGTFHGAALLAERGGGAIINTASIAGLAGLLTGQLRDEPIQEGAGAYVAAKHGVVGITRQFAVTYGARGVRVNAVCPGYIHTPMTQQINEIEGAEEFIASLHPMGRMGEPQENRRRRGVPRLRRRLVRQWRRAARRRRLHRALTNRRSRQEPRMPAITAVRSRLLRIPLDNPTSFSNRTVYHRDHPIVEIEADDGHRGIGFCYAGNSNGQLVTSAVDELFAPLLMGQDPFRVEGLWAAMYQESLLHGRAGSTMRALSALDIALWDRNARAAGLPLWRMLGGYYEATVPAYASGGYYLEGKGHEGLQEELSGYLEMGFDAVKIKVGRLSVREEASRMQAAREAVGPEVHLMLDANNAWSNLEDALRYMQAYEPWQPYWIEEAVLARRDQSARETRAAHRRARGDGRDRGWALAVQGPARPGRGDDFAARRRRAGRNHGVSADRGDGGLIRRLDLPALVPRSAPPPRGGVAQRHIRRVLPRRSGAQLPQRDRPPDGGAQRSAGAARGAGVGLRFPGGGGGALQRRELAPR